MRSIFVLQIASTFLMTGIIWFVQVAHYPLFALAGEDEFSRYATAHAARTGWIVGPLMLLEMITALLMCLSRFRPTHIPGTSAFLGAVLLALIWISTAWVQVPLHNTLAMGYQADAIRRLLLTNWIRTIAWTLRAAIALWWITIF